MALNSSQQNNARFPGRNRLCFSAGARLSPLNPFTPVRTSLSCVTHSLIHSVKQAANRRLTNKPRTGGTSANSVYFTSSDLIKDG
ncbi:hypothetical protein RRG08_034266 [Elysia crispata]|uniref:Uncharacterized protein n=1 Tax=Elysia crispata TaxID=231223 RepID=A0AAE1DRH8_9GAST|nr:hypothetical protein RRG08_034266 [Elysia crispata]